MWNIRSSTEDRRGREGKLSGKKSETETKHETLLSLGSTLRAAGGQGLGGWGDWGMGIEEDT